MSQPGGNCEKVVSFGDDADDQLSEKFSSREKRGKVEIKKANEGHFITLDRMCGTHLKGQKLGSSDSRVHS